MARTFCMGLLAFGILGTAAHEVLDDVSLVQYSAQRGPVAHKTMKSLTDAGLIAEGMHVHRDGYAIASGAVAYGMMTGYLKHMFQRVEELVAKDPSLEERAKALIEANKTRRSSGVLVKTSETQFEQGTIFVSEVSPDCDVHDWFGDSDCVVNWGAPVELRGNLIVGDHIIEQGAQMVMKIRTQLTDNVLGGLVDVNFPDKEVSCNLCGDVCQIEVAGDSHDLGAGPCPLEKQSYSFWQEPFNLPSSVILKTLEFKLFVDLDMMHANGSKILTVQTTAENYNGGSGGWWDELVDVDAEVEAENAKL